MNRPISRLLHDPKLRDEVFDNLSRIWPATASSLKELNRRASRFGRSFQMDVASIATSLEQQGLTKSGFQPDFLERGGIHLEAIIRRAARPVFYVQDNSYADPPSEFWCERLAANRQLIESMVLSVGRVELKNHETFDWNGTAWLVRDDVIVTNAHVAKLFASRSGAAWVFRQNVRSKTVTPRIDFREEYQRPDEMEIEISEILFIEDGSGPDIALLRGVRRAGIGKPIPLATSVDPNLEVITIGFPKEDSSVPDAELVTAIFDDVYNVKRISPGIVGTVVDTYLTHDCTTLGGSSGSVVANFRTGEAVGLHFGGNHFEDNYAVPATAVSRLLNQLGL